jgi:hypothetical protein
MEGKKVEKSREERSIDRNMGVRRMEKGYRGES